METTPQIQGDNTWPGPDGSFQVRQESEYRDEQHGGWFPIVRVYAAPDALLLELVGTSLRAAPAFQNAHTVDLDLQYASMPARVRLDLRERTWVFHPHDRGQPLETLSGALLEQCQNRRLSAPAAPITPWRMLWEVFMLMACGAFVAAGIFVLVFRGENSSERMKALAATAFFALCAIITLADLVKSRRGGKQNKRY